ncbi:hypothetical protein ABK040_011713 [Willaertia magna]
MKSLSRLAKKSFFPQSFRIQNKRNFVSSAFLKAENKVDQPKKNELFSFPIRKKSFSFYKPSIKYKYGDEPFDLTNAEYLQLTRQQAFDIYYTMHMLRNFEFAAASLFEDLNEEEIKDKRDKFKIRGFLHLYIGQEAIATALKFATSLEDALITAYRDHPFSLIRGNSIEETMAELIGSQHGSQEGRGGSMHLYNPENNFYGGWGIVGSEIPLGTGLAFAKKHLEQNRPEHHVAFCLYGDGAANQGQVYESFNMAKMWKLPVIYLCENNQYGMKTSAKRASSTTEFYKRGDYIPGIKVDGMDVISLMEAVRISREYAKQYGPIIIEAKTFRFVGHSATDSAFGSSYRSMNEVEEKKEKKDPIKLFERRLKQVGLIRGINDLKDVREKAKSDVLEEVELAMKNYVKSSPKEQLARHVYLDDYYKVRGRISGETLEADKEKKPIDESNMNNIDQGQKGYSSSSVHL